MLGTDVGTAATRPFSSLNDSLLKWAEERARRVPPYVIAWWFLTIAIAANNLQQLFPGLTGPLSYPLIIAGTAGCAWAWLLARTLFRPEKRIETWVLATIGCILVVESAWALFGTSNGGASGGEVQRMLGNATSLVCIAAMVLGFVEASSNLSAQMPRKERQFRIAFIAGYGGLILVAMVWAINAEEGTVAGHWQDAVLTTCGVVGVVLTRWAVSYRKRNPWPAARSDSPIRAAIPSAEEAALADRILARVADEEILTTPNLKVADFADRLGEHDYKVTQCITGRLQFRNFNHFINSYRIERAKTALADPDLQDRPILSIAFDCGFNSIGPFNRAFKREVGMTPSEFRASRAQPA